MIACYPEDTPWRSLVIKREVGPASWSLMSSREADGKQPSPSCGCELWHALRGKQGSDTAKREHILMGWVREGFSREVAFWWALHNNKEPARRRGEWEPYRKRTRCVWRPDGEEGLCGWNLVVSWQRSWGSYADTNPVGPLSDVYCLLFHGCQCHHYPETSNHCGTVVMITVAAATSSQPGKTQIAGPQQSFWCACLGWDLKFCFL